MEVQPPQWIQEADLLIGVLDDATSSHGRECDHLCREVVALGGCEPWRNFSFWIGVRYGARVVGVVANLQQFVDRFKNVSRVVHDESLKSFGLNQNPYGIAVLT